MGLVLREARVASPAQVAEEITTLAKFGYNEEALAILEDLLET